MNEDLMVERIEALEAVVASLAAPRAAPVAPASPIAGAAGYAAPGDMYPDHQIRLQCYGAVCGGVSHEEALKRAQALYNFVRGHDIPKLTVAS